jgi:organic radical activating enzyme
MDIEPVGAPLTENVEESSFTETYRVKDVFRTIQGEGFWAGRPAVFVRFVLCNMWSGYEEDRERDANRTEADCPLWCDTDFTKEGSDDLTAEGIARRMRKEGGEIDFCVLTGGEPFLQADASLVERLHEAGYQVSIETNGTVSIERAFWSEEKNRVISPDWITCSPKLSENQLELERFDELKLIVPDYLPSDYMDFANQGVKHVVGEEERRILSLQPEDGPRIDKAKEIAAKIEIENTKWSISV